MSKDKKKNHLTWLGRVALFTLILTISALLINYKVHSAADKNLNDIKELRDQVRDYQNEMDRLMTEYEIIDEFATAGEEATQRKVLITSYGTWDGESGNTTSSTKKIKDFKVNEEGMYTFEGMVVLATANKTKLDRPLRPGYKAYEINDIIVFDYLGKTYQGIVLDVCGACYGWEKETTQRLDIFTESISFGKKEGVIYE